MGEVVSLAAFKRARARKERQRIHGFTSDGLTLATNGRRWKLEPSAAVVLAATIETALLTRTERSANGWRIRPVGGRFLVDGRHLGFPSCEVTPARLAAVAMGLLLAAKEEMGA